MASLIRSNRSRGVKNSLAKWLITLGGISVLFTLVLIFLYLLYVVKPIFDSAKIEPKVSISLDLTTKEKVLSTGVDELQEVAYEITEAGNIDFYHLKASVPEADNQFAVGDNALSMSLFANDDFNQQQVVNVVNSFSVNKLLHTSKGKTLLIQPSFYAKYANDTREIIPQVNYPLGQDSLIIDEQQTPLSHLAFAIDDERIVFVGFTEDKRLIKTSFIAEDYFSAASDGDDVEYETIFQQIELVDDVVDEIKVTPDLSLAFIRSASTVYVYSLNDDEEVSLKATFTPTLDNNDTYLTSMALLSGSSSVLLGDSSGRVSQWFEVSTELGRQFKQIRRFDT
ncbi:MAG: phosphate ABC transporter permease, partial [Colwellia sp.]